MQEQALDAGAAAAAAGLERVQGQRAQCGEDRDAEGAGKDAAATPGVACMHITIACR